MKLKKNQPNQQRVLENLLLTIDTLQNRNFRLSTVCHSVRVRNGITKIRIDTHLIYYVQIYWLFMGQRSL